MRKKGSKQFNNAFKQSQVILAYLFGSEARGDAHQESDVDIAVLFDKQVSPKNYLKLEGKLISFFSKIYQGKEINIINLNTAPPLLKQSAVLEGLLLYAKNELTRILFQLTTLHQYEDYKHLNAVYNLFLKEQLQSL